MVQRKGHHRPCYEQSDQGSHSVKQVAGIYTSQGSEKAIDALTEKIADLGNGSQAIKVNADLRDPSTPKHVVE